MRIHLVTSGGQFVFDLLFSAFFVSSRGRGTTIRIAIAATSDTASTTTAVAVFLLVARRRTRIAWSGLKLIDIVLILILGATGG
uniref:Uncharacterized protein n=1 Tax=Anopheles darlingi TaxID=43151 RepID=A0A2M4DB78_ANODA